MEDFLAKWASGDLSETDKKAFESDKENKLYQDILNGVEKLDVPAYNSDALYAKLKTRIENQNSSQSTKVISMIPKWLYAVAASVILIFGFTIFYNNDISYTSDYGEKISFTLPDNSEVILNANSHITYDNKKWESKRELYLEGEAFFKVIKGSKFTVLTKTGSVSVLGTQFNVNSNKKSSIFQVDCFEGVVKVEQDAISKIIKKGEAVRIFNKKIDQWKFNELQPLWITQESAFYNSPIKQVIKALENQYDIKIESSKVNDSLRFTGVFTHSDLDKALKIVFESLDINYELTNNNSVILDIE